MSRLRFGLILVISALVFIGAPSFHAQAVDANATNIADGLKSLLPILGNLGAFDEINSPIPLTEKNIQEALSLDTLFSKSLTGPLSGSFEKLTDLQSAIEGADYIVNGVTIDYSNVIVTPDPIKGNLINTAFDVAATHTISIPLATVIPETNTILAGGSMSLTFTAATHFAFQLDTLLQSSNPDLAFYLTNTPIIQVGVQGNGAIDPLTAKLGIMDTSVTGQAQFNLAAQLAFQNPDSDTRITIDEWQNTAIDDLINPSFSDSPGDDINVNLTLSASDLGGAAFPATPGAMVTWQVANINDGLGDPIVSWNGGLESFSNLTADELLTGLAQSTTGLVAAQSIGDMPIPFIDAYLGDAFMFAQPLIDFVEQQGLADISCGTEAGTVETPPAGDTSNINAGTMVYCRAYTLEEPISVTWAISPTTTITNSTALTTVGTAPSEDMSFKAQADGKPDIQVSLKLPSFGNKTIQPRFDTVQEFFSQLRKLGGFSDLIPADVSFNPSTSELTYHLHKELDPVSMDSQLNFGDQIEEGTGLTGLTEGASAPAEFSVSDIELDFTFGVVLAPGVPEVADRFFLRVRDDAPELQATVEATATIDLKGQIGFVDVSVSGDPDQNPDSSKAFAFGPANPDEPMVSIDITATNYSVSGTTIIVADAIGVQPFLKDIAANITADCNVALSAGLMAQAEVSGIASASGGVHVAWSDVFSPGTCTPNTATLSASAKPDFTNQFQGLNLSPTLFGSYTNPVSNTMTLTDSGVDFDTVDRELIGVRIVNQTDGSSCVITAVDGHTLTCESGLQGGLVNAWQQHDNYKIEGNPFALLNIILDNLEEVVSKIDEKTGSNIGGILDKELPLLATSPNDLISQFRNIQNALDEIRVGGADATIACGPINVEVINGAFNMNGDDVIDENDDGQINGVTIIDGLAQSNTFVGIPVINGRVDLNGDGQANDNALAPAGDPFAVLPAATLYCQATTTSNSINEVQWSIEGGTSAVVNNGTALATVGTAPTAFAAFTVNYDPDSDPFNYRIGLRYNDAGGAHGVSLPSLNPPRTLAVLEQVIEEKLGIPEDALTFEITDLPPAGSSTPDGNYDLVMRLGYGICTQGNEVLAPCPDLEYVLIPRLEQQINIDLADAEIPAGLVGLESSTRLYLEFLAEAQLDMGIALSDNFEVVVLDSTEVNVELAAAVDDVNFKANVGPLSLLAGDSAVFTGTHTVDINSSITLTDTGGINFITKGITETDTIVNITDSASCEITAVTATTIACSGGLTDGSGDPAEWNQDDEYRVGGNGAVKIGLGFTVSSTVGTETSDPISFVNSLNASFEPKAVIGGCTNDICAALSLALAVDDTPTLYLGDLTLEATVLSDGFDIDLQGTDRIAARINVATLDWLLLFKALPELFGEVENGLQGAANDIEVPLVGDALDAGADVAGTLRLVSEQLDEGVSLLADNIGLTPAEAETNLENYLNGKLDELVASVPDLNLEHTPVDVILTCDPGPCIDQTDPIFSLATIQDVRATFVISQSLTHVTPTFDLGIPGVPLRSAGTLDAGVSWSLVVDFGLSKDHGPYLVAHDKNSTNHKPEDTELTLEATVQLGDSDSEVQASCIENDPLDAIPPDTNLGTGYYHESRCLLGQLAFLQVHLRDRASETERTRLVLDAGLNLVKDTNDILAIVGFRDLINRSAGLVLSAGIDANVDVRLRTGLVSVDGFPTVLGTFKLEWGRSFTIGTLNDFEDESTELAIAFDNIYLDAGSFLSQFLIPVAQSVQDVTSPLMPVIETVSSPLPVLSDLSRMTGSGDVSLITLMEQTSGSDLTMLRRILEIVKFANAVAELEVGNAVWIPLGQFSLHPELALAGLPTSGKQRDLIDLNNDFSVTSSSSLQSEITKKEGPNPSPVPAKTFDVSGLTFPFIQEPTQIFGLLLGEDATLVRYDAGTMRATASVDYTFRFAVGPVPMSVSILGTATLEGRFAIGYDTYGIRQVVNGENPVELLNGIFIDDLDANGRDVPEIILKGTIAARAAVDLVIISAGVEGGIELTVDLNLDDRPDPDGKLRLDEIVNKLDNPICLFVVDGRLEAFFGAFVKIDFFFFSKTWRFELARVTLLDFQFACEPPQPKLAKVQGNSLILLMGSNELREERGVAVKKIDEAFTVRMLEGGRVSVAAFGEYQTFCCNFDEVIANAGDGDDVVSIEAGSRETEVDGKTVTVPIPFTIPVTLNGGDDNDELRGGDADDTINGGNNNDKLFGGGGVDTIHGNDGDDTLEGGLGDDKLYGDNHNDRIGGGPGADRIEGGSGDDQLTGGPGTNEGKSSDDLGDTIIGNDGNDDLSGGLGNDLLYGDGEISCSDATSTPSENTDLLVGGSGADHLFGGKGEDKLIGGDDGDTLCGNGDDDVLFGDGDEAVSDGVDIASGGPGDDLIYGDGGGDTLKGDSGNDTVYGGSEGDTIYGGDGRDLLYGESGDDTIYGDDGASFNNPAEGDINCNAVGEGPGNADCLFGDEGTDTLYGEGGHDFMYGDEGTDTMNGNAGVDTMRGGKDNDTMNGNSEGDVMFGDSGADTMHGNAGADTMRGGIGVDTMYGNGEVDTMYGDADGDEMYGNSGNDIMFGNDGDDKMQGNANVDTMEGGPGQDDMIGGSTIAGAADDGDIMHGNTGHDVMVGDNGSISRTDPQQVDEADGTVIRTVVLYDLATGNDDTNSAGVDTMHGDDGNDDLYGGGEADYMYGNSGDDLIEGNGAGDFINGDLGQDDLIGGTSQEEGGTPDGGDTIEGGDDYDAILGDNGAIARDLGQWQINGFNEAVTRQITLYDIETEDNHPPDHASGGDILSGGPADDIMYGQGNGDDLDDDEDGLINEDPPDGLDNDLDGGSPDEDGGGDYMHGGDGDDYMEGNAGADWLFGDAENDDIVGGTGRVNEDPEAGTPKRYDGADTMFGGSGYDVMAGDNAIIVRTLVDDEWQPNTYNDGIQHERRILLDTDSLFTDTSGPDTMYGNDQDDLMYGQGKDDFMYGGNGDDVMEGNAASDTMEGNANQDDMYGGTSEAGLTDGNDVMSGGNAADVMLGDNGLINRVLTDGSWTNDKNTLDVIREVTLYDVETTTNNPLNARLSGHDELTGNDDNDIMFGQGGHDTMSGGAAYDYMEGNAGKDIMDGGGGEDDLIGGGSANDGVIVPARIGDGLTDGADIMTGDDEGDVMSGDNARLLRLTDEEGFWQVDPNSEDVIRDILLFDVEGPGSSIDPDTSGSDYLAGGNGRDLIFGQGNDASDVDGDGHFNEDPSDGIDNDRDGREDADSVGYDCADGRDNDGDKLVDADEPSCTAAVDEDGGGDELHGGNGDDYMEGNHGSDWLFGNDGEDDMLGGNSAGDGHIFGGIAPTDLADGDDVMHGGLEDDHLIGDNGMTTRPTNDAGLWLRLDTYGYNIVVRETVMEESPEEDGAAGNDYMTGDSGHDEIYGQLGDDYMEGNDGDDAMVGDLGEVVSSIEDGSREQLITIPAPFIEDTIYPQGTLYRRTELFSFLSGDGADGKDTMLGGQGMDNMHGGAGDDIMNGNGGEDHLFGGDDNDALWGGLDHDHLWGGYSDDHLDVVPREERLVGDGSNQFLAPADPPEWFTYAREDNYQGLDTIYGGWDQDALQADIGGPGLVPGDRLIDWVGGYNVYYVCPAAYGEGVITRILAPQLITYLQDQSEADGAVDTALRNTSGFRELAMVFAKDVRFNANPIHPDHTGHFTCVAEGDG